MDIRINKYLSEAGFCSRRAADKLLEEGRVSAGGRILRPGDRVDEQDEVFVDEIRVKKDDRKLLFALNKPKGVVSTATDRYNEKNVVSLIDTDARIYPVGRLDKDSTGLILLTNNGDLTNRLTKASLKHEKEYIVTVNKDIDDAFIKKMGSGVYLKELEKKTAPCRVEPVYNDHYKKETKTFRIVLVQGLNRQIRRMCEALGYRVRSLKRVRIMNIRLEGLKEGEYRQIEGREYDRLLSETGIR